MQQHKRNCPQGQVVTAMRLQETDMNTRRIPDAQCMAWAPLTSCWCARKDFAALTTGVRWVAWCAWCFGGAFPRNCLPVRRLLLELSTLLVANASILYYTAFT